MKVKCTECSLMYETGPWGCEEGEHGRELECDDFELDLAFGGVI
jgi:hypothetical protein